MFSHVFFYQCFDQEVLLFYTEPLTKTELFTILEERRKPPVPRPNLAFAKRLKILFSTFPN